MNREQMIEKLRDIQYRLFGPVREQSQSDRDIDAVIAALAAPVAAEPRESVYQLLREWLRHPDWCAYINSTDKECSCGLDEAIERAKAVAADPPFLVALVQEWQAATAVVRQLNEDGGGEDPLAFSIACEIYDRAGDALLAWTPAQAEPAAPCVWSEDDEGQWRTGCGHYFEFYSEPPHGWMKFCAYCAALVALHPYDEPAALPASTPAAPEKS